MSCNNCDGTVWFDHKAKVWKHGTGSCKKPEPKAVKSG